MIIKDRLFLGLESPKRVIHLKAAAITSQEKKGEGQKIVL